MSIWKYVPLEDVATIERSAIRPDDISQGTPYLGLEHIENGGEILGAKLVNGGELASAKFKFTERHLLYGKLRPYLAKIALPDFTGICSTDILPILPGPDLERRFLCYFLRKPAMVNYANSRAAGANLPRLHPSVLAEFKIPLPPLAEQRRIAEVLDRAEALRTKRRAALAQLDTLTQSFFVDIFGDPIPNDRGWNVLPVGQLDVQIADGNYSSQYPTSSEFVESGIPFIRANNLRDLTVVGDDLRFISHVKHLELQKGHLLEGDVLITTRGDIGNIAIVPHEFNDANINAQIVLLRPNRAQLDSRYLAYLLNLPQMKVRLQSFQSGVALKQLPIRQLVRVPIPVPPISLQHEFARRVRVVEKLKASHRASLMELDALFASLQQHAFREEL